MTAVPASAFSTMITPSPSSDAGSRWARPPGRPRVPRRRCGGVREEQATEQRHGRTDRDAPDDIREPVRADVQAGVGDGRGERGDDGAGGRRLECDPGGERGGARGVPGGERGGRWVLLEPPDGRHVVEDGTLRAEQPLHDEVGERARDGHGGDAPQRPAAEAHDQQGRAGDIPEHPVVGRPAQPQVSAVAGVPSRRRVDAAIHGTVDAAHPRRQHAGAAVGTTGCRRVVKRIPRG